MTAATAEYLKAQYGISNALGERSLQSDSVLVIQGFEFLSLLIKAFPWPVLSTAGEVEGFLPNGQKFWQEQQLETALQGQITITETAAGHAYEAINRLARQGRFNGTVFEGQPEKFSRAARIEQCFMKIDPADRDHESRSQITQYTGTLFYHFYGDTIPGNIQAVGAGALGALGGVLGGLLGG